MILLFESNVLTTLFNLIDVAVRFLSTAGVQLKEYKGLSFERDKGFPVSCFSYLRMLHAFVSAP